LGEDGRMKNPPDPHYRHRFPAELICHAVWLYPQPSPHFSANEIKTLRKVRSNDCRGLQRSSRPVRPNFVSLLHAPKQ
jgi:hypothetical protein